MGLGLAMRAVCAVRSVCGTCWRLFFAIAAAVCVLDGGACWGQAGSASGEVSDDGFTSDVVESDAAGQSAGRVRRLPVPPGDRPPETRYQVHRPRGGQSAEMSEEELRRIEAMGYLPGVMPARAVTGVTVHDAGRVHAGLNLYTSGHGPEAVLMDMGGRVLHRWRLDIREGLPDYQSFGGRLPNHWRRVWLGEQGDVIAIYGGYGMVRVDRDSRLLWRYTDRAHHDLEVLPDGTLYTLTRYITVIPRVAGASRVIMDAVSRLDAATGRELERWSLYDAFLGTAYEAVTGEMARQGDVFHANTIEVFDGRLGAVSPLFRAGNVLVSLRNVDFIGIVDGETKKFVWGLGKMFLKQHQPVLLESGRMILFDNVGLGRDRSRILEFDPFTQAVHWEYGRGAGEHFSSRLLGSVQRLGNGNTLITESDNGRVFEVTPGKEVVWEFVNPNRAGEQNELIASIYELIRLDAGHVRGWLSVSGEEGAGGGKGVE